MASAILTPARRRDQLSNAIIDSLMSWPAIQRDIFVRAHYWGDSVEAISRSLGLPAGDVRLILEQCSRRLCAALRPFRGEALEPDEALADDVAGKTPHLYC